jgi:hypothetical protein
LPLIPIAAFLTGALLTLLLPVALLISLAAWYWLYSARAPAADERPDTGPASSAAADPAPAFPPEPGQPAAGA